MYQICERAQNLKSDDRQLIMLARMLYSESDIYIIEDFLDEGNSMLHFDLVNTLFEGVLKPKTVIFNSSYVPFINLSNQIVQFDQQGQLFHHKTDEFKSIYL